MTTRELLKSKTDKFGAAHVADVIGCTEEYLAALLSGEKAPGPNMRARITEAWGPTQADGEAPTQAAKGAAKKTAKAKAKTAEEVLKTPGATVKDVVGATMAPPPPVKEPPLSSVLTPAPRQPLAPPMGPPRAPAPTDARPVDPSPENDDLDVDPRAVTPLQATLEASHAAAAEAPSIGTFTDVEEQIAKHDQNEGINIGGENVPWEGRDLCLCLPWYKFPAPQAVFAIMAFWDKRTMRLEMRSDDAMIARSRNHLAKRFLATYAQWSLWIDDDVVVPFGIPGPFATMTGMQHLPQKFAATHTPSRLVSHGKTVVGGCYWDRRGSGRLIAGGSNPILAPIPSDHLAAVKFVGTGCLLVHRKVFEDIAAKFPEVVGTLGNEAGYFTPMMQNGRMLGEDEAFAWRATEAGHPSYLDLGVCCAHVGEVCHGIPTSGSKI